MVLKRLTHRLRTASRAKKSLSSLAFRARSSAEMFVKDTTQDAFHATRHLAAQLDGEFQAEALPKGMRVRISFPAPAAKQG
jgi:hypothetical protein